MELSPKISIDPRIKDQELHLSEDCLKFQESAKIMICGSSGAGKSSMILHLLANAKDHFTESFKEVFYVIPHGSVHMQSEFLTKLKSVRPDIIIRESLWSDISILQLRPKPILVIIDDCFMEAMSSQSFSSLITFGSRKNSISVVRKMKLNQFISNFFFNRF